MIIGGARYLPRFLGEREFPPTVQRRVLGGGVRFLRCLERVVRPRRSAWLSWPPIRLVNLLLLVALAFLLALPLPSPPFFFSNSVPGYATILMAASMMEEDGALIWAGYAATAFTFLFFGVLGDAIAGLFVRLWHFLPQSGIPL
jgi:hypothetical protein